MSLQAVNLVLHQGDERRDDHRDPAEEHRRQLIAERLAAPRGHQNQGILSGKDPVDYLFLKRQEAVEAEMGL